MSSTQAPTAVIHTVHLLPPDTTQGEQEQVTAMLHSTRSTFTYSADAAHAIVHAGLTGSKVIVWSGDRWQDDIYAWLRARNISADSREFDGGTPANPGHDLGAVAVTAPSRIAHTIHLLPQDITLAEVGSVTRYLYPTKSAFTYSADAAHALVHAGDDNSKVVVWSGERWSGNIYTWLSDRGITFVSQRLDNIGGTSFLLTHWPTQNKTITQRFLERPDVYTMNGLKGHDGLDIVATTGSPIMAAAAGRVYRIVRFPQDGHNYGNAVYLQHEDGYRSAYGHLQSIEPNIDISTDVAGGQLLGRANSTGNSTGSHLHLTLYLNGASERGETPQPFDIIDPEPYLTHLLDDADAWEHPGEPLISGYGFAASLEVRGVLARVNSGSFINFRTGPDGNATLIGRVFNDVIVRVGGPQEGNYLPIMVAEADVQKTTTITNFDIGMHNEDGAEWMRANGVKGWALQTVAVGSSAIPIDATRFENAGIKLLVRLNYGYGSTGNIPKDDDPQYEAFIQACIDTVISSRGVWGWVFGNETNNSNEFPGNNNGQGGEPITPERYARVYNRVWNAIPAATRMAPQAVDPYFDPKFILNIDSRDYFKRVLDNIAGAEFLTVHPKTQDSNPNSVDSDRTFGPGPLSWQFFHLKAYQPLLDVVPPRFRGLPVIATEVNPQRHNDMQTLGWQENQGAEWVRRAVAHFKGYNQTATMPITGIIFYRFSGDAWELNNKPSILAAVKNAA